MKDDLIRVVKLSKTVAEGLEKGLAEGLAEGEHKQAIESARKMLSKGYNEKDISDVTGLSVDEIEKLKQLGYYINIAEAISEGEWLFLFFIKTALSLLND